MSNAGMHSFEHLIGIFEGSSPLEDEFLKGEKSETKFLASYDPERAAALASLLAKNQTWQCPTLVWERGGNLIDVTDFSKDAPGKIRSRVLEGAHLEEVFTEQVKTGVQYRRPGNPQKIHRKRTGSRPAPPQSGSAVPRRHGHARPVSTFFRDSACTRNYSASWPPVSRR